METIREISPHFSAGERELRKIAWRDSLGGDEARNERKREREGERKVGSERRDAKAGASFERNGLREFYCRPPVFSGRI